MRLKAKWGCTFVKSPKGGEVQGFPEADISSQMSCNWPVSIGKVERKRLPAFRWAFRVDESVVKAIGDNSACKCNIHYELGFSYQPFFAPMILFHLGKHPDDPRTVEEADKPEGIVSALALSGDRRFVLRSGHRLGSLTADQVNACEIGLAWRCPVRPRRQSSDKAQFSVREV